MKLNDIKSGYLVELSDGKLYMKMRSGDFDPILISESDSVIELKGLDGNSKLDEKDFKGYVRKVYGLPDDPRTSLMFSIKGRQLLYEYIEPEKEETKEENCEYVRIELNSDGGLIVSGCCSSSNILRIISYLSDILKTNNVKTIDIVKCICE